MKENEALASEVLDETVGETVGETDESVGESVGAEDESVTDEPADDEVTEEEPTEEVPPEPTRYTDDDGTWEDYHNGIKILLEPSEAWTEANQGEGPKPKPRKKSVWDELAEAYAEGVNSIDK